VKLKQPFGRRVAGLNKAVNNAKPMARFAATSLLLWGANPTSPRFPHSTPVFGLQLHGSLGAETLGNEREESIRLFQARWREECEGA